MRILHLCTTVLDNSVAMTSFGIHDIITRKVVDIFQDTSDIWSRAD